MFGGDERTIAPTPRRLAEARRAGFAPHSHQLTAAVTAFAGIVALCVLGDDLWTAMTELLQSAWSAPVVRIEESDAQLVIVPAVQRVALLLAVILCSASIAAVVGAGLQKGFRFQVQFPGSGWQHLNPWSGLRRIGSGFRLVMIGGLTVSVVVPCLLTGWMANRNGSAFSGAAAFGSVLSTFGLMLGGAFLLLGIGDWVLLCRRYWRSLRMTVAEAREEARAAKSPRRQRTRRQTRVSDLGYAASAERPREEREETATLSGARSLLPSDPLIP